MRKTRYITFCAMMAALSVVMLLLGALTGVMDLTAVVVASAFVFVTRQEIGYKALAVYFATIVIAIVIPVTFVAAIEYAIIAIYPIIKPGIDRCKPPVMWCLKLLYILAASAGIFCVSRFLVSSAPLWMDILLAVGCVLVFLLYDILLHRFAKYYGFKLRHKLRIDRFFNQY